MNDIFESIRIIQSTPPDALEEYLTKNECKLGFINHLLHTAYDKKRNQFFKYLPILMSHGANINQTDRQSEKMTIFMSACVNGESDIVRKMLEYSVDLKLLNSMGNNVLVLALSAGKKLEDSILETIITKQPSLVELQNGNKPPLTIAVEQWRPAIIKAILNNKVNVNHINSDLETVLHIIAHKFKNTEEQVDIIKILLQRNIDIKIRNKQGRSALELVNPQYEGAFEQLILIKKQQRKRSKHDVGKEILKSNNKMIKNNIRTYRLNDKTDDDNLIEEGAHHLEEYLLEKIKRLEILKKEKEDEIRRVEVERTLQNERNNNWIIPNNQLKYYLEEQIKLFSEQIEQQNNKDKEHYDKLIGIICDNLEKQLDIQIKVYGSFATRLCLAESDIDVVVLSNNPIETVQAASELLQKIDKKLRELPFINSTKFIKSAAVPVVKVICTEQYNSKKIDITLRNSGHNGLDCVEIIKKYMDRYKELRPLAFVLKTFIYSSNLYDTYQGGLSSYGLILMIVSILQGNEAMKKDASDTMISELLIKFLWCFGFGFDYINKAIFVQKPTAPITSTTYKGFFFPLPVPEIFPKLVLMDPLNNSNNVGRSTHQIKQVQKAFSNAYTSIHTNYSCLNPECQYRKRIQKKVLPKPLQNKKARPCCILKRMFECGKAL